MDPIEKCCSGLCTSFTFQDFLFSTNDKTWKKVQFNVFKFRRLCKKFVTCAGMPVCWVWFFKSYPDCSWTRQTYY